MNAALQLAMAAAIIGLDNLAAALALGALGQRTRMLRVAATFTLFGMLMPFAGAALGAEVSERLTQYGELIGAGVLGTLGIWITIAALRGGGLEEERARRVTTGGGMLLLALTLSVDNLVVGFGMGMRGVSPLLLAAASGAAVLVLTVAGMLIGDAAHRRWERRAHVAAGALLIAVAVAYGLGWF